MKIIETITLLAAIYILQACSSAEGETNSSQRVDDSIPVRIEPLHQSSISTPIRVSGQFTTDDETFLAFKTGGVIDRVFVKEGDRVKAGQLMATLNLTEIDAQVAQAKLAVEKATRDYQRAENLYRDSVATLEQLENAKTGLDVAQQQFNAARFNRSYSEIRAVTDGFVLRKLANEGQVISSGTSVFQTNGAGMGHWKLRAGVSDMQWAELKIGDKATITGDAFKEEIAGTITRKSEGTDPSNGLFTVEITLSKTVSGIAAGMFGKALITPSNTSQGWTIPFEALLDGHDQNGFVFVTNDNATAKKIAVTVSGIQKQNVLVTAGLEEAKSIIVSGSAYLNDGGQIRVIEN